MQVFWTHFGCRGWGGHQQVVPAAVLKQEPLLQGSQLLGSQLKQDSENRCWCRRKWHWCTVQWLHTRVSTCGSDASLCSSPGIRLSIHFGGLNSSCSTKGEGLKESTASRLTHPLLSPPLLLHPHASSWRSSSFARRSTEEGRPALSATCSPNDEVVTPGTTLKVITGPPASSCISMA
jgi:hypothetical protein